MAKTVIEKLVVVLRPPAPHLPRTAFPITIYTQTFSFVIKKKKIKLVSQTDKVVSQTGQELVISLD